MLKEAIQQSSVLQDFNATKRHVALAQSLIANLGDRTTSRAVRDLADSLLEKLLKSCTDLLWQPDLISALLAALDADETAEASSQIETRIAFWLRKVCFMAT